MEDDPSQSEELSDNTEFVVESRAACYRTANIIGRLIMRLRKDNAYRFYQFIQAQQSIPVARRAAASDPSNYDSLGVA